MEFEFDLQLFGGGGGLGGMLFGNEGSSSQSYEPSPEEKELYNMGLDSAKQAQPYIKDFLTQGYNQINNNLLNVDYNGLMNKALGQVDSAQQGLSNLANGQLPTAFTDNMAASLKSGVDKTVGSAINGLGNRGILNSSVTSGAMNDISKNVSDTMAQQYTNNIGTVGNLLGQQLAGAGTGLGIGQAGQQAAMSQGQSLMNMASGMQGNFINNLLGSMKNGTTTQTETAASPGLVGLAGQAWLGKQSGSWF